MENLKTIGKAISAYQQDHDGEMPDWLSDLYPEYLQDPKILICPADKTGGSPAVFAAYKDPKIPSCSYFYQFNPMKFSGSEPIFDINPPKELTYKKIRTMQLKYFGNLVPVVRCAHHSKDLYVNLSYDGKIYLSPTEAHDKLQETYDELRRTQAQLIQSEKMAGLGTMIAGVAHEINNPISFVHGNMPILEDYLNDFKELMQLYKEGAEEEKIEDFEEEIDIDFMLDDLDKLIGNCKEGAERVRQIVLDLRNFSRLDESKKKRTDIHEGIESTLTIVHNRLKNKVTVHKNFGDIPKILCYPGQLNQVIMNLLTNATDAIEGKGDIWITTWIEDDLVKISVRDNGKGIPDDVRTNIFDPFFTTKPVGSGTGLGLSVSYEIIEKHGGTIELASEIGVGTTFTISIPKS